MIWLTVVRTVVISLVLGLTIWLGSIDGSGPTAPPQLFLTGIVVLTYASTIVYALLLRRGVVAPERLVWPQLGGDLAITTALVYVTGGAQSAYTFFYALSVVAAGATRFRRGALVVGTLSFALMLAVGLAAWARLLPLPTVPRVEPWTASASDLGRQLGLNLGAIIGVSVLSYIFGRELQETSASLASQRRFAADLYALNRDIVRSLSSGLVTVDLDDRVLTLNATAGELLGVDGDDAAGRPLDAILPGLSARIRRLPLDGSLRRSDLAIGGGGAGKPARVLGISVSPLRDDQDVVIGRVVNFQDLTELRALEEAARRSERLATVGQLAAGIAHEIRNPLASISGSVELLAQAPRVSEDDKALMAIVVREIERLDHLIHELLEYANPRPRTMVEFDVVGMLDEVAQVMRQDRTRGDVALEVALPPGPVPMTADPAQLRQVAWNLCRNAAEAASAGGRPGKVTMSAVADAAWVTIEVEDDGPGIAPEHLARIFDPFFTTKKRGTGLGLATCHTIVTDHGGTIDVRSEPGRGTRFIVRLPRAAPAP